MIDINVLKQISFVIEHDATSSTYKYVLLKSVIHACQKFDHLIISDGVNVKVPLGLLIEQWIFDYMPFVLKDIAQQHSGNVLDKPIENLYFKIFSLLHLNHEADWVYALTQFRQAYESPSKSPELSNLFIRLSKNIATKITTMPMKYIGHEHYQMFQPEYTSFGRISIPKETGFNTGVLIQYFGFFTISEQHYQIYRYLGQNLFGTSTIISKWKAKTHTLNMDQAPALDMIDKLSSDTLEIRSTTEIRSILTGHQECVWSGRTLKDNNYDVDHVLPFSIWFNNDLWNMLPSDRALNQQKKKDKIPTPQLIEQRSDIIKRYWGQYAQSWPQLFRSQMELSLCGKRATDEQLFSAAIESLCQKCHYLIFDRGHEQFKG